MKKLCADALYVLTVWKKLFSPLVKNPESINMQISFILKVQTADVSFVWKGTCRKCFLFPRSLTFVCPVFHYDQLPNMHGLENLMESTEVD